MKWDMALRVVGVIGIVAAYAVFKLTQGMNMAALGMIITAIIALISPEVLSELPWGPTKG